MKEIKAISITIENFLPYFYIANVTDPSNYYGIGEYPTVFHRDIVFAPNVNSAPMAFCSLKIYIIEDVEYHTDACEVI